MKKVIMLISFILIASLSILPTFAANSATQNSVVMYLPIESYESTQVGMMAFRPRFAGTVIANTTVKVGYGDTYYYAMNYFPLPTNWYNYNNGVYINENGFNCIPIELDSNDIDYKTVTFNDSATAREISMQLGDGIGGVMHSAPDLYFDGILGIYDDGYSMELVKTGEVSIKLSFNGQLYYSDGSNLVVSEFIETFVIDDEENTATIDSLIRDQLNDPSLDNTDIVFKGSFCIIASNAADVSSGLTYDYDLNIYGDPKSIVYTGTDLSVATPDSDYVIDKFTKMLTTHYSSPTPTPTYPAYSGYTDVNGDVVWYGTYTNGKITVNVPTYKKDSKITLTRNGKYDVGGYNYVEINVPQENVTIDDVNMFNWLASAAESFLTFEIAPDFSIGGILLFVLGFSLVMWILKIFLGG